MWIWTLLGGINRCRDGMIEEFLVLGTDGHVEMRYDVNDGLLDICLRVFLHMIPMLLKIASIYARRG